MGERKNEIERTRAEGEVEEAAMISIRIAAHSPDARNDKHKQREPQRERMKEREREKRRHNQTRETKTRISRDFS